MFILNKPKPSINIRVKEHFHNFGSYQMDKSVVATQFWDKGHNSNDENNIFETQHYKYYLVENIYSEEW